MTVRNKMCCLQGLRKKQSVSSFLETTLLPGTMWTSARTAVGWENPRTSYEEPEDRMTHAIRQRQLHDEDKSCGIQPAHIRVIYRRLSLLFCPKFTFSK